MPIIPGRSAPSALANRHLDVEHAALRVGGRRERGDAAGKVRPATPSTVTSIGAPSVTAPIIESGTPNRAFTAADVGEHEADAAGGDQRADFDPPLEQHARRRRNEGAVAQRALGELDLGARRRASRLGGVEGGLGRVEIRPRQALRREQRLARSRSAAPLRRRPASRPAARGPG